MPILMTTEEVAELLRVSKRVVHSVAPARKDIRNPVAWARISLQARRYRKAAELWRGADTRTRRIGKKNRRVACQGRAAKNIKARKARYHAHGYTVKP